MEEVVLSSELGEAALRLTPWDRRALGLVTAEVARFAPGDAWSGGELLRQAEEWCRQHSVQYMFGRFDAADLAAKKAVLEAGFAIVECSLALSRSGFEQMPVVPRRIRPWLRSPGADDLPMLEKIAREDFRHGRFLEDPAISTDLAATRTANWVRDLAEQRLLRVAGIGNKVIGFHAERIATGGLHADLVLTGVAGNYAPLALALWVTVLEDLGARGVQRCSTLVSAANVGVMNLYNKLGFRCDRSFFGFRKYL